MLVVCCMYNLELVILWTQGLASVHWPCWLGPSPVCKHVFISIQDIPLWPKQWPCMSLWLNQHTFVLLSCIIYTRVLELSGKLLFTSLTTGFTVYLAGHTVSLSEALLRSCPSLRTAFIADRFPVFSSVWFKPFYQWIKLHVLLSSPSCLLCQNIVPLCIFGWPPKSHRAMLTIGIGGWSILITLL